MLLRVGPTDFRERTDDRDPKTAPICVATATRGGGGGAAGVKLAAAAEKLQSQSARNDVAPS